mgnify:CR=1 FL=1|tara:strand:+ start:542 stop:991 length:450 start_codon:yes stop_codon:yes gene_type:complete
MSNTISSIPNLLFRYYSTPNNQNNIFHIGETNTHNYETNNYETNEYETNEYEVDSDTDSIIDHEIDGINPETIFYMEDGYEYSLNDLKNLDKETRESIIDFIVEDEYDIAIAVEEYLYNELETLTSSFQNTELIKTRNLLKQFIRILNH